MTLEESKLKFIQAWGSLGTNWGINRTMAQVHALLMVSAEALSADDIMAYLQISRGNANMNIRALIDIGLVYKSIRTGERREFFIAEKEMSKVVRQIILHRKKKELEPLLHILQEIKTTQDESPEAQVFSKTVENIQLFAQKADTLLDMLVLADVEMLMQMFSQE